MECLGHPSRPFPAALTLSSPGLSLACFTWQQQSWQNGPRNRKPLPVLGAQGLWSGISENLREFVFGCQPNAAAKFYVPSCYAADAIEDLDETDASQFFEDITSLYQRQTMLFKRSCQQLTDMYQVDLTDKQSEVTNDSCYSSCITQPSPSPFALGFDSSDANVNSVDTLYVDCIQTVLNMIGCDADRDSQFKLIEHLRKAFRFDSKKHLELYEMAANRPKPVIKLNFTVLEARDLATKDISGMNNPFCTFYLKSNPSKVFSTECQSKTRNPIWDETFVIQLPKSLNGESQAIVDDVLHVDVWNFCPDEKIRSKLKRIQDGRGLRMFLSETLSAAAQKSQAQNGNGSQHKLIGSVEIQLRHLPASGLKKWWNIEKLSDKHLPSSGSSSKLPRASSVTSLVSSVSTATANNRGEISLSLHLSTSDKTREEALEDHRRLLRVLVAYELLQRRSPPMTWKDDFCKETLQLLSQHAVQSKLSRDDTALTRWFVYCEVHAILPLDHGVFTPILEKLRKTVQGEEADKDFHDTADKFATQCLVFIKNHRKYMASDLEKYKVQLEEILKCLHVVHCLKWRTKNDIALRVENAIRKSIKEWFEFVEAKLNKNKKKDEEGSNEKMIKIIQLAHLLIADINSAKETYGESFSDNLNVDYTAITFKVYDKYLSRIAKPVVESVCDLFRPPTSFPDDSIEFPSISAVDDFTSMDSDISVGTKLFELYLCLQQFYQIGISMDDCRSTSACSDGSNNSSRGSNSSRFYDNTGRLTNYHEWFIPAVAKWLDIALFKAMKRILKAVEIDNLVTVDELVRHSTSAVDIRTVFGQVRTFWNQLKWPDPDTAFVFMIRILDDICRASIFYADRMKRKVEFMKKVGTLASVIHQDIEDKVENGQLFFSKEQCLALNNIDYVLQALPSLLQELGMSEILVGIEEKNGGIVADVCKNSIKTLMRNATENVENQILKILQELSNRMAPLISESLDESIRSGECEGSIALQSRLLHFMDENLIFLRDHLVKTNFDRALNTIWSLCVESISKIISQGIADKNPPAHFTRLYHTFRILLNFFFGESLPEDDSLLPKINRILKLYSSSVDSLILHYFATRYAQQKSLTDQRRNFSEGSVTIRALLLPSSRHLRVEILNARHLKPAELIIAEDATSIKTLPSRFSSHLTLFPLPQPNKVPDNDQFNHTKSKRFAIPRCHSQDPHASSNSGTSRLGLWTLDSVRLGVQGAHLKMHKNLATAGHCNPYITIRLVPDSKFRASGMKKVRTRVHQRTLFPLFDETFDIVLSPDDPIDKGFLHISVKDQGVMGEGILLGEAFVPLGDIASNDLSATLQDQAQKQIPLTRPRLNDNSIDDILFAIQIRATDAHVKSFLRKERRKMLL